ncbi:hypothetical protein HN51_067236 [Arachis hypogaea]|uniref:PA domain-containing protein n=1 Tax=Arachis hypogaea TaxID=3818 RepID=A0A444ZMC3_ARAHY|nr:Signal peptide peptidase-like [Arachis hypogaea]RYR15351.1 hypothetical protein Ahy_B04g072090 [Arachis hypogaea]
MTSSGYQCTTTKANIAKEAGASAILITNNRTELFKMVCEENETDIDIGIPTVMLPQDAAEVFLWLMAVGTILCASYWSAWTTREAAVERKKLLKDASDEYLNTENAGSTGYVEISTMATISFVVIASCFLLMLYKLMASWFIEVLVVLFCIGGVEVSYSFPDFVPVYYDHSLTPPFRVD